MLRGQQQQKYVHTYVMRMRLEQNQTKKHNSKGNTNKTRGCPRGKETVDIIKTKGTPFEEQKELTPMRVADVTRGHPRRTRKTYTEKQRGIPLTEPNKMLGTPNKSSNNNKKDMGEITPINMLKYQQTNTTGKQIKRQHNSKGIPFNKGDITQGNTLDIEFCSHNNTVISNNAWGIPQVCKKTTTIRLAMTT